MYNSPNSGGLRVAHTKRYQYTCIQCGRTITLYGDIIIDNVQQNVVCFVMVHIVVHITRKGLTGIVLYK